MAGQVFYDGICARLRGFAAHRMELNAKLLWVRGNAQVTVIGVVKIVDRKPSAEAGKICIEIVYLSAAHRIRRRDSSPPLDEGLHVIAPVAGDDERHGVVLPCQGDLPGVTLIIVRVTGEESVRVNPLRFAD